MGRVITNENATPQAAAKGKSLREIILFRDFSDEELAIINQMVTQKKLPKGTPLYVENMLGETMYVVSSGKVKISKNLGKLGEKNLIMLGPGDFFGELALFDGSQRLSSAVCTEDSEIFILQADDFKKLMVTEPKLALKFLATLVRFFGQRLRKNDTLFTDFFIWQLTER